jgi:mono/diheme cytochrome c family protein
MLKKTHLVVGSIAVFALSISLLANAADKIDLAKTKRIFAQDCSPCHGLTGHGDGPAAASFQPKPRDLSDGKYVSTLSDEYLFKLIREGGAAMDKSPFMPPWKNVLSKSETRDIITYIREDICKCQYKRGNENK